jgi:very-short-patch-repair endonuclease
MGLDGCRTGVPHITTMRNLSSLHGIRVCRRHDPVPGEDRTTKGPIPLTMVARTIIDLAAILPTARLQHALDSALHKRMTTVDEVARRLDALNSRGRRGAAALRAMLGEADANPAPQSILERRFITLAKRAGTPFLQRQFEIEVGWEEPIHVDFAFPAIKLAIETDGYGTHSLRSQWELDRRRDAALMALGWIVLRFSWGDIDTRPEYVVNTIRMVVKRRGVAS